MAAIHFDTEPVHENVVISRGARSGLPIVVAVHSTALGQAIGGCRLAHYPHWRDGLTDALRLSAAMSQKCALAGLPNGGGKTVVALPPGGTLDATARRAVLHDAGDVIASLGGTYATGPDVGTGPDDMVTIAERTGHAFCRPVYAGGSGDSSGHTAVGVLAALHALCAERFGSADLSGRSFAVLGLGHVGGHLLRLLADAGASLVAADIDESRRTLAVAAGATWVSPQDCLTADVDVLVPAALGGAAHPAHRADPALRRGRRAGQQPTRRPGHGRPAAPARHSLGAGHHRQRRRHHPRHRRRAAPRDLRPGRCPGPWHRRHPHRYPAHRPSDRLDPGRRCPVTRPPTHRTRPPVSRTRTPDRQV